MYLYHTGGYDRRNRVESEQSKTGTYYAIEEDKRIANKYI